LATIMTSPCWREALLAQGDRIPADVDAVVGLIDHRRAVLQRDATFLGERVFAERPKVFQRRLRHYWMAWRPEADAKASEHPGEPAEATRHAAPV
jgi:hypothetical protein